MLGNRFYKVIRKNNLNLPMKIAILSEDASLYSTKRLKETGEARSHDIKVINYLRCYIGFAEKVTQKFMPLLTKNFLTN